MVSRFSILLRLVTSWWSILIVCISSMWGIWEWRDLSLGDTSYYFRGAQQWADAGAFRGSSWMTFSPLYMTVFGGFARISDDAYAATIAHRIAILLFTTSGVFLVARRLLPRVWAWLAAVWWVVLPINWNAYFEVHVFGFGVLMWSAGLCASRNRWWRASGVSLIFVAALLVRNEFLPGAVLLALWMSLAAWRKGRWTELKSEVAALLGGLLCTVLCVFWLYSGNLRVLSPSEVISGFEARQRLNLQQVYAFGYKQRHSDFLGDPWTEGGALMLRDFGRENPTISEASSANRRAVLEHIRWNLSLVPSGIQFGIFGRYAGTITPDFGAMKGGSRLATVLSYCLLAIAAGAMVLLVRSRKTWVVVARFFARGAGTWAALGCMMPSVLLAIVTQRPRPSYIFPLSFGVILVSVFCLRLIVGVALPRNAWIRQMGAVLAGILLVLVVPPSGRPSQYRMPLVEDYSRLKPYRSQLPVHEGAICSDTRWGDELANYLGDGYGKRFPAVSLDELIRLGFANGLKAKGVTWVYLSGASLDLAEVKAWSAAAAADGWRAIGDAGHQSSAWKCWVFDGKYTQ